VDASDWDERYAGREPVWSRGPNVFVERITSDLEPGHALDLAAGEGRNALWLASRGWTVEAVDFSREAIERGRAWAAETDVHGVRWVVADVLAHPVEARGYDLVLLSYLHLPRPEQLTVTRKAASAVAPGGMLLIVGHDPTNLTDGHGGPQEPEVLHGPEDYTAFLDATGLEVERAEHVTREVETEDGTATAIDALVVARRPA
jgi:SAM-dependent methyltransferase